MGKDDDDVDPVEFARAMLGISKEDAAIVRERTPPPRKRAWRVLFEPGPAAEVRAAFDQWQEARSEPLADDEVRVDLIHSAEGELMRVLIDADAAD